MIVAYCADTRLHPILPTAINSLLIHNPNVTKVYCIIENDNLYSLMNPKIECIDIHSCKLPQCKLNISGRYPYAAMTRCFLDLILKEDKVIYLDVDTIVTRDISELWNADVTDNYIAAVPEHDEYYNSGVMLMNLDYMRKHNSSEALSKFLNSRMYLYPDQEAINHVFAGKIKRLSEKFNAWSITKDPYAKPFVIRHFTGKDKPWNSTQVDKRDIDLWNSYYAPSI